MSILGDARVFADFGTGRLSGTIDNLSTSRPGEIIDVGGRITIGARGSRIGGADPNDARTTYGGRFSVPDLGSYRVSGTADGKFRGTRVSAAGTPDAPRALAF